MDGLGHSLTYFGLTVQLGCDTSDYLKEFIPVQIAFCAGDKSVQGHIGGNQDTIQSGQVDPLSINEAALVAPTCKVIHTDYGERGDADVVKENIVQLSIVLKQDVLNVLKLVDIVFHDTDDLTELYVLLETLLQELLVVVTKVFEH